MQEGRAVVDPLPAVNAVAQGGVQALQLQNDEGQGGPGGAGDQGDQGLPPVLGDVLPGGIGQIPEGVRQPVVVPIADEW